MAITPPPPRPPGADDRAYAEIFPAQISEVDFGKAAAGILPVVTQEQTTGRVLMLAYCSPAALEATLTTGYAHYYSRSRGKIWKKGETSGNFQLIQGVYLDCDGDTLLYTVRQQGPGACHTGRQSCFYRELHPRRTTT